MEIKNPQYFGKLLLSKGFRVWFLYMFSVIEERKFIEEPYHKDLFDKVEKLTVLDIIRLITNLCPRSGKTTLATYLLAYCYAINPKCNFIYTSYSQSLLGDISRMLIKILEHPIYKSMYNLNTSTEEFEDKPINDFWRGVLEKTGGKSVYTSRKIVTGAGGVALFASVGSSITGYGAGIRGYDGFGGMLICFPYDEYVLTDIGKIKIGDIVNNELNVKVASYNEKENKIEYKDIQRYFKNPVSYMVEIKYFGGKIKCTPEHKIYTKNRGYVEAKDLTSRDIMLPYIFNLRNRYIEFISNFFPTKVSIKSKFNLFFGKLSSRRIISKAFSFFSPVNTFFYRNDICSRNTKVISNNTNSSFIRSNLPSFFRGKFSSWSINTKWKCTMPNSILHIFRFSAIGKIFKFIIRWISVKMSCFYAFRLFTNKSPKNKPMNSNKPRFVILSKINIFISFIFIWIKNFFFKCDYSPFISRPSENITRFAYYLSFIRYFIKTLITRNLSPYSVSFINHSESSFCLTVRDNHNLFVGQGQEVLVSNCDDADKPSDINSEVMRTNTKRYYDETLLSRVNNPNTPIWNIQQRLHLDDLTSYLIQNYDFEILKKPLILNGVCQLPSQYDEARLIEIQKNNYMFQAQYQQEPISAGGNIFKENWFEFTDKLPLLNEFEKIYATIDTAYSDKETADYTVISIFGILNAKLYLIDVFRNKIESIDIPTIISNKLSEYYDYNLHYCWIEPKASGLTIIQALRKYSSFIQVPKEEETKEFMKRIKNKVERANDCIGWINEKDKNILINKNISCYSEIKGELFNFPNSIHDDFVDTFVDGINLFGKYYSKKKIDYAEALRIRRSIGF